MIGDILQPTHLLFVLVIALVVLGPKRLPEVGRSLGRGLRDFRTALSTDERDEITSYHPEPVATPEPVTAHPGTTQPATTQSVHPAEPQPATPPPPDAPAAPAPSRVESTGPNG